MKEVPLKQRTPEWHAWRNAGVTASEMPVLMGSPYKTVWRAWAEKRGLVLPENLDGNPNVIRGNRFEPVYRDRYEERYNTLLLPMCAESTQEPLIRASFDGIDDNGNPVELKAPSEIQFRAAQQEGSQSEQYLRYYGQVQTQIFVAETDKGILSLNFGDESLDFSIPRNDAYIQIMLDKAREFWVWVKTGQEPPMDPARDLYLPKDHELATWLRLAADYRQLEENRLTLKTELAAIDANLAELEDQFVVMMGDFLRAEHCGVRLSRYVQQGRIDYKSALTHLLPSVTDTELAVFRGSPRHCLRVSVRDVDSDRNEVPFDVEQLKQHRVPNFYF